MKDAANWNSKLALRWEGQMNVTFWLTLVTKIAASLDFSAQRTFYRSLEIRSTLAVILSLERFVLFG